VRCSSKSGEVRAGSPPQSCTAAAAEARSVLRALREEAATAAENQSSDKTAGLAARLRVRVELPLPPADVDTDEVLFLGLWGQAADWSGGMQQRFRVTRAYVEEMLDGYDPEFLGVLEEPSDGVGVWRCERMTVVTHVADATARALMALCQGDYGSSVLEPDHLMVVVNAFWTEGGGAVGQPWEVSLRREARVLLSSEEGSWDKVYCLRAVRSAAGVDGTLWRKWPGPWRLLDSSGSLLLETSREPSIQDIASTLNGAAGAP